MEGVGWIGTLVVGGLIGWTGAWMKRARMGPLGSILSGIAGAVLLNFVLVRAMGAFYGGWIGQFVVAAIGAGGVILLVNVLGGRKRG